MPIVVNENVKSIARVTTFSSAVLYAETLYFSLLQFEKRNGSTRAEVVHDAIQVANIADMVSANRSIGPLLKGLSPKAYLRFSRL